MPNLRSAITSFVEDKCEKRRIFCEIAMNFCGVSHVMRDGNNTAQVQFMDAVVEVVIIYS
jgi:hypothetical protein